MPGKQRYFFPAVLLICFGFIAVSMQLSLWLSVKAFTADCRDANPTPEDIDDSQSPWPIDAIAGIQSFSIFYCPPTTRRCINPHTDAFLIQPYFEVATPPPWSKN